VKIRKLKSKKELVYPDDGGEVVKCPVCRAVWMHDDEQVADPACPHLRFVYCTYGDPDFVLFVGKWQTTVFKKRFLDMARTEEGILDEMAAFRKLTDPNVDLIVYHDYDDDPMVKWSTYWGLKIG